MALFASQRETPHSAGQTHQTSTSSAQLPLGHNHKHLSHSYSSLQPLHPLREQNLPDNGFNHRNGHRPSPLQLAPHQRNAHNIRHPSHRHRRRRRPFYRGLDHPRHKRTRGSQRGGSAGTVRRVGGHQESAHESRSADWLCQGNSFPLDLVQWGSISASFLSECVSLEKR